MPIYVYEPQENCTQCGGCFEVQQNIHETPLTHCPTCSKPCQKIIASFSCGPGKLGFDLTKAKQSGMQVLKRRDRGVYEKL